MENQVRIYRKNPVMWSDKNVMRHLRTKYGQDKKRFVLIRSVYLALCEIESDFTDQAVNSFNKTVGTYAGVSRGVAGKYINLLISEGLITKTRVRDEKTKKYLTGTTIEILDFQSVTERSEPLSGYPNIGLPQRWLKPTPLKNISINKKLSINNNVSKAPEKIEYYSKELAKKLHDEKSISFYKQACLRHDPDLLLRKAHEIVGDGAAKNPGAVFVSWIKTL